MVIFFEIVCIWSFNPTFWCSVPGLCICIVLFILVDICYPLFWGMLSHTPLCLMRIALGPFYSGTGAAIGPNVLWSTPFPAQESTLEVTLREFPRHWCESCLADIWCCKKSAFYTVLPQKMVYRQNTICRQTHRLTHASHMPVSPVSASKPKFQHLHGSWFWVVLVPFLSGAG